MKLLTNLNLPSAIVCSYGSEYCAIITLDPLPFLASPVRNLKPAKWVELALVGIEEAIAILLVRKTEVEADNPQYISMRLVPKIDNITDRLFPFSFVVARYSSLSSCVIRSQILLRWLERPKSA